jgi:hypothetical protein
MVKRRVQPGLFDEFEPMSDSRSGILSIRYRYLDIGFAVVLIGIIIGVAILAQTSPASSVTRPPLVPLGWLMESWHDMRGTKYNAWKAKNLADKTDEAETARVKKRDSDLQLRYKAKSPVETEV